MVMEFVMGETLQNRLKRLNSAGRRLSIKDVITFTSEICDAADYAHQRGMIHRDIKPANIMLDVNGKAILMDFGIARMVSGSTTTAAGTVLGTARYMSPEQIQGLQIDTRADIYSIGITLYEMLSGKPPFDADSAMTLMMMHVNDPVPDLHELHPDIPSKMVEITNKALEKNRNNRYQSASEMADALRKVPDQYHKMPVAPVAAAAPDETLVEFVEVKPTGDTLFEAPAEAIPAKEPSQPITPPVMPVVEQPQPAATPGEKVGEPIPQAAALKAETYPEKITAERRKSKVWMPIVGVLIILILAGGGYFTYTKLFAGGGLLSPAPSPTAVSISASGVTAIPKTSPSPTATIRKLPSPTPTRKPTPTITPTSTPFASLVLENGETLLYSQDFESGKAPNWNLYTGWNIIETEIGYILQGNSHNFAYLILGPWKDYSLRFRLKLNQLNSAMHANIRQENLARYFIGFNRTQVYLSRQDKDNSFHDLVTRDTSLGTGWHDIEINAYGGLITVFVDGNKYLSYTDPDPLLSGRVSFESLTPDIVWVDDVAVIAKPQP
jgi:hypothetical protein